MKKILRAGSLFTFAFLVLFCLSIVDGQKINLKNIGLTANVREGTASILSASASVLKPTEGKHEVVRVVDGDTFVVRLEDREESVRLIGINAPESVDPQKPIECFASEAREKAKEILLGMEVRLERDETQGDYDKYGRLLRYVFLEDGTFLNKFMIENGYAREYTYDAPYAYQKDFMGAENKAKDEMRGLWGVCGL